MDVTTKRKIEECTVEKFLRKRIRIEDPHAALKHLNILTVSEIEEVAKAEGIKAADLKKGLDSFHDHPNFNANPDPNSARINRKIAIPAEHRLHDGTTKPKTVNGWRGLVLVDDTGKEE